MTGYIVPEYEEISKSLQSFSDEHSLDMVTLNSLIRGSVEIIEPEKTTASDITINPDNWTSGKSIKITNIKINLKFALNSVFSFKSICDSEGIWLILAFLKAILFLREASTIELDVNESIVLFCIYRLQTADSEEIVTYAKGLNLDIQTVDIHSGNIENILKKLENIGTIKLEAGKYILRETIMINKS